MRIGYFGLPLAALLLAVDGHDLRWAVLSPIPAPGQRRLLGRLGAERVIDSAEKTPAELVSVLEERRRSEPVDLVVSWFWTRRLDASTLAHPPLGAIGAHPSLLPRHRGPNPYFWTIDAGDDRTGVTVHRLAREYDTGEILARAVMDVGERDAWQLARALDRVSLRLLRSVVRAYAAGMPPRAVPQDHAQATLAPEPTGELLKVDWRWSVDRVLRRIRALSPVPGLALNFGGTDFFVTRAERVDDFPGVLVPGEGTLWTPAVPRLVIRTGDGAIVVTRAVFEEEGSPQNISGSRLGRLLAEAALLGS